MVVLVFKAASLQLADAVASGIGFSLLKLLTYTWGSQVSCFPLNIIFLINLKSNAGSLLPALQEMPKGFGCSG